MQKQYKLYEDAKASLQEIIEVLRDRETVIDVDIDLYFTSFMLGEISKINKLFAEKLKQK